MMHRLVRKEDVFPIISKVIKIAYYNGDTRYDVQQMVLNSLEEYQRRARLDFYESTIIGSQLADFMVELYSMPVECTRACNLIKSIIDKEFAVSNAYATMLEEYGIFDRSNSDIKHEDKMKVLDKITQHFHSLSAKAHQKALEDQS